MDQAQWLYNDSHMKPRRVGSGETSDVVRAPSGSSKSQCRCGGPRDRAAARRRARRSAGPFASQPIDRVTWHLISNLADSRSHATH